MTLSEFFAALTNTAAVVSVVEMDGETESELTKVYVSGYQQLLTTLLSREVSYITITNQNTIKVVVAEAA